MTNIIRFEIKTDAPYTEKEKTELLENFFDFMQGVDGDVIEDSENVEILDVDDASTKQEVIQEFLDGATFETRLSVTNGGIGFETTLK